MFFSASEGGALRVPVSVVPTSLSTAVDSSASLAAVRIGRGAAAEREVHDQSSRTQARRVFHVKRVRGPLTIILLRPAGLVAPAVATTATMDTAPPHLRDRLRRGDDAVPGGTCVLGSPELP